MSPSSLRLTVEAGVGVIQSDHPDRRNALGWEMYTDIIAALEQWAHDDTVAALMFVGTEEYFCAGWALDVLEGTTGPDKVCRSRPAAHDRDL